MKLRPVSVLLSLVLVGAVAGSAISQTKDAKAAKKMDVKADLEMVKQAEAECKDVDDMVKSMRDACDSCSKSNDPKVLRGTIDKMAKNLKMIKDDEDKLTKQLKSLEFEFHAPMGY